MTDIATKLKNLKSEIGSDEIRNFIFDQEETEYSKLAKAVGIPRKEIVDIYLNNLFELKIEGRYEQCGIEGVLYKNGWDEAFRSFLKKENIPKEEIQKRATYFIERCKLDEPGFYFDSYSKKILEGFMENLNSPNQN